MLATSSGTWIDLLLPRNPEDFWTMVAAIVTIGLLVAAVRGLSSLSDAKRDFLLAKKDFVTRAERDARHCAIARCEEMAEKLIKLNGDLRGHFAALGIPVFVQSADEVRFNPDNADDLARAADWVAKLPHDVHQDCIRLLNHIEAWAMYFTNGVADHRIAFGPCASVYYSMIMQYYPVLMVIRARDSSGKFPNLVDLFHSWRDTSEAQQTGAKLEDLLKRLNELNQKAKAHKSAYKQLPPPLGLE